MNFKYLLQSTEGCTIIAFNFIYLIVNFYILYLYFIKGERRLYMQKLLLAFVSFFLLGLQELLFYSCFYSGQEAMGGSIALLNVRLFIYTSCFIVMTFQSLGFLPEGIGIYIKYQACCIVILFSLEMAYYLCNFPKIYYAVLLSGLLILLVIYLLWKFSTICLNRYETIVKTMEKENMTKVFLWIGVGSFFSYVIFISLVALDNNVVSIIALVLLFMLHCYFIFKDRRKSTARRVYYSIGLREEGVRELLMEERITEDFKIIQRLVRHFEDDKPYLDKNLKLGDVAKRIYTNKTYLSRALNKRMYKNFNQFVNYYRVKEACCIFLDNPLISLNDMCYNSGFKSLSSFSSSFNLNLRYTPAEWCKEVKKKIKNNENISIDDYFI